MGNQNTFEYAVWGCPDISGRAFRVLMRMAAATYDWDATNTEYPPGLYFGGWKALTLVLGYELRDEDDRMPPNVERTITRAMAELRDAGYIKVADRKTQRQHGHRAYWVLPPDLTKTRIRSHVVPPSPGG